MQDKEKDISSQKLKEQLAKAEEREADLRKQLDHALNLIDKYRHAANGSSEGLWDLDLQTQETWISDPWREMLGYAEGEVDSRKGQWEELLHPDDKEYATQTLDKYIDGKINKYEIEFRMKHKDGNYRWIRSKGKLIKDRKGIPMRVSGTHADVTERKLAMEALEQSEKKYKHLFENSLVGMFRSHSETSELLEANQKAWEILGLKAAQKGINVKDIFADPNERIKLRERLFKVGYVEDAEVQINRIDGELVWVAISARYYPEESIIESVIRDITDFKENLLELQRLNFELDNFVYHASHDIRSPLRSIMGLINILEKEKSPSERTKVTDMIKGSINRLDKLVVDLLSMSRENRLTEPAVNINFLIEVNNSITNFYHPKTCQNLEIRSKISQKIKFSSDITKIRIILNNLISNAIKYRDTNKDLSFIYVNILVSSKEAKIVIEDNGEGISSEKLDKIYDMFYRASESSEGSGLGMYIVKNVIKKLDANIEVESTEGEGSKFTVVVPNAYNQK